MLVPKPDGTQRFCIDYRKLNKLKLRDTYPLTRIDECLDSLGYAKFFTTLDCNNGYWKIPILPRDQDKTTFTCHSGTFRFNRMPFGLMNAPETFQRALDIILSKYRWRTCLVYLDDVIVFSKDVDAHLTHINEGLAALSSAGFSLKLPKCRFLTDKVQYLGHVIRPNLLEVARKNVASIAEAKPPKKKQN